MSEKPALPMSTEVRPESLTTESIADELKLAVDLSPEEQEQFFQDIIHRRRLNDFSRHHSDDSMMIDDAIVRLVEEGDNELAARLITPSFRENDALHDAVRRCYPEAVETSEAVTHVIEGIARQKSEEFTTRFREYLSGVDSDIVEDVLVGVRVAAANPESALEVPPVFWEQFHTMPEELKDVVLGVNGRLTSAVEAVRVLDQGGLLEYAKTLVAPAAALPPAERESYVVSAGRAIRALEMRDSDSSSSLYPHELASLACFRDPQAALDLAMKAFPRQQLPDALSCLATELSARGDDERAQLFVIPEDIADILPGFNEAFRRLGMSLYEYAFLAKKILALQPDASRTIVPDMIDAIAETVPLREHMSIYREKNNDIHVRSLASLFYSNKELTAILQNDEELSEVQIAQRLARFAMKQRAAGKEYHFVREFLGNVREAERRKEEPELEVSGSQEAPDYAAMMERRGLDEFFDGLGLPRELAVKFFETWKSYSPIHYALGYDRKKEIKDLTDGALDKAALRTAEVLHEQLTALQTYCERYGTDEVLEIYETFGILNFTRGTAEQFHDQLMRWKDSSQPVENIHVAATEDYNFAFGNAASTFFTFFGEKGSFYFEAPTLRRLSQAFVQAGNRERMAGRNPEVESSVHNIVISGHGEPTGVTLSEGNILDVEAYARAELNAGLLKTKINNYRRHLGNAYRIILNACSAGKNIPEAINISQLLHSVYGMPVEAAPEDSYGYSVDALGNVSYRVKNDRGDIEPVESVRHG